MTLRAVLVLPALAWWLSRTGHDEATSMRVMRRAVAAYLVAAAATLTVSLLLA